MFLRDLKNFILLVADVALFTVVVLAAFAAVYVAAALLGEW
jgi:hypothetical protein